MLARLRDFDLEPAPLDLRECIPRAGHGDHAPTSGRATAHDLSHILEVSRVVAAAFTGDPLLGAVSERAQYPSVMS